MIVPFLMQVDPVGDLEDLDVVVGDDDHRDVAALLQLADQVEDQPPLARTHRRERLVEEEDGGAGVDGAGDGDRLPLSAREHRDLGVDRPQGADPDVVDVLARALSHLAVVQPTDRADAAA